MTSLLRQLQSWRTREQCIRLAWGGAKWFAIVASVLAFACLADWLIDRFSGSESWRKFFRSSRVFAPSDPLSIGETPIWLRVMMTFGQLTLAVTLFYYLLVRPFLRTPPVDDLATVAEKAFPIFDHRLVTAIQLNRATADRRGMSDLLIAEVTREAGEMTAKHNLLTLVEYRRLAWAVATAAPIALGWIIFFLASPALAGILVERQLMPWASIDIPRDIQLENVTKEVWPTGAEVTIRYKVTGGVRPESEGILRIVPFEADLGAEIGKSEKDKSPDMPELAISKLESGGPAEAAGFRVGDLVQKFDGVAIGHKSQFLEAFGKKRPGDTVKLQVKRGEESLDLEAVLATKHHVEEFYPLAHETTISPEEAIFSAKLPAMSRDFDFQARLSHGRTTTPGRVTFEAPPQLASKIGDQEPITAEQVLPLYLGVRPDGQQYLRRDVSGSRGEVVNALPQSSIMVEARFNKPIKGNPKTPKSMQARLIPVERVGDKEHELPAVLPFDAAEDRLSVSWGFATTPKMIGYRLELVDDRGFTNPVPIRRNIRMWEDRPPVVDFKPESTRNPNNYDPYDGGGNPKEYNPKEFEWDMPLGPDGTITVIYNTRSDVGVRTANIRYRVIPKGVNFDHYPEEYKRIQHPREDPNLLVYDRLTLTRFTGKYDLAKLGPFVPSFGLFELIDRVRCQAEGNFGPFDPDLGLFRYSFHGLSKYDKNKVSVQFYPYPSTDPANRPGELEAGGRYIFEVSGLLKKMPERLPDGTVIMKTGKIEIGDTVELYLEVFDKVAATNAKGEPLFDKSGHTIPDRNRVAGYTREAKRKIVMSEVDVATAIRQRDEARQKLQDKLRELATDQSDVFRPKKK